MAMVGALLYFVVALYCVIVLPLATFTLLYFVKLFCGSGVNLNKANSQAPTQNNDITKAKVQQISVQIFVHIVESTTSFLSIGTMDTSDDEAMT